MSGNPLIVIDTDPLQNISAVMTEIFRFFFDTINPISIQYAGILTNLKYFSSIRPH